MKLEEASLEEEDPKYEDLGFSKGFSSKTNNHQNQSNFVDDKDDYDLQLLNEFNVRFDDDVTVFTKMDFIKLNPIEKKCLSDLNSKCFNHTVTFSKFLIDEENFENTNEYSVRTAKLVDRINFLGDNQIK